MIEVLELLKKGEYYGAGEYTEIAKGKYKIVTTFKGMINKMKRINYDMKRINDEKKLL